MCPQLPCIIWGIDMLTNKELVDSILNDLNNVIKTAMNGQHLQSCVLMSGIAQRLVNLREAIDNDLKNRDETIEKLKQELKKHGVEIVEKELACE